MKCGYCGFNQDENSVFCVNCGAYIKSEKSFDSFDAQVDQTENKPSQQDRTASPQQQTPSQQGAPAQGSNTDPRQNYNGQPQGYNGQPQNAQLGYTSQQGVVAPPAAPTHSDYRPPKSGYGCSSEVGAGIASLVFGILSIVCSAFFTGVIFGIVAIVLGVSTRAKLKKQNLPSGNTVAAIVLGIIGIVISLSMSIAILSFFI